jgi:hypothetical protein
MLWRKPMRFRRNFAVGMLLLPSWSVLVHAQSRPATTTVTTSGVALEATITGVQGQVQVRMSESEPWQIARAGMTLGEGAEFRTGPRSAVRFTIPPAQTITLDRLGVVKLLEAVRTAEKVRTNVGMRYGRVHYDIQAAGQAYDASIHSPGSALAIRGTQVILTDTAPFPPTAVSLTGRARFSHDARTIVFGGSGGKTTIESGSPSPAESARQETVVDPSLAFARSESEEHALVMAQATTGIGGGVKQVLPHVRAAPAGPNAFSEAPLPQPVPGNLVFQLVWVPDSAKAGAIDLDLSILSPLGEQLCPKDCLARVPSGGRSPVDATSAAPGKGELPAGQERAVWPASFPSGRYGASIDHVSGDPAQYQLVVFRNGVPIKTQGGRLEKSSGPTTVDVDVRGRRR